MKLKKLIFIVTVAVCVSFVSVTSSCDKYAEGPMISLMTAKARLSGDWKMMEAFTNGVDVMSSYPNYFLHIEKNGNYSIEWSYSGFQFSDTGKWNFNNDKSMVRFVDSDGDEFWYTIVMLKNKNLKLREDVGASSTVYTYQPSN
jgi:hypothetical protein